MTDREPADASKRAIALDAVIQTALEQADRSSWRQDLTVRAIKTHAQTDVSERTIRRARQDAQALGWVTKDYEQDPFEVGPRAQEVANRD